MEVEYLSIFSKDLDKIKSQKLKESIRLIIAKIEDSESLAEIPNVKRLASHKTAYRIRIGDFRLGFFA